MRYSAVLFITLYKKNISERASSRSVYFISLDSVQWDKVESLPSAVSDFHTTHRKVRKNCFNKQLNQLLLKTIRISIILTTQLTAKLLRVHFKRQTSSTERGS